MYLCFVDESGTPPSAPSAAHPYFTLAAAIIAAADWSSVAGKLLGFRLRHKLRGEMKWRYFSPRNSDVANPLATRTAEERKVLSLEFAHIIAASPVTIIACVTDVELAFSYGSVTCPQDLYHFAYRPITERFQYFLQDRQSYGIVVSDHRGRDSDRLFRAHHGHLIGQRSLMRTSYDRLIEGLFLQDSSHSVGIQIADYVAGAIHRAYNTADSAHATVLRRRFRADASGSIMGYGLVHHPKSGFRNGLGRGRRAGP